MNLKISILINSKQVMWSDRLIPLKAIQRQRQPYTYKTLV